MMMQIQINRLNSRHIIGLTNKLMWFLITRFHSMNERLMFTKEFLDSLVNYVLLRTNKKRQKCPTHYCYVA